MARRRSFVLSLFLVASLPSFAHGVGIPPSPLICGDAGYGGMWWTGVHVYAIGNDQVRRGEDPCPAAGLGFSGEFGFGIGGAWLFSRTGSTTDPDGNWGQGSGTMACYGSPADAHHGWDDTINVYDEQVGGGVTFVVARDWNRTFGNGGGGIFGGPGNDDWSGGACGDGLIEPCPDGYSDSTTPLDVGWMPQGCNHLDGTITVFPWSASVPNSVWVGNLRDLAGADGAVLVYFPNDQRATAGEVWTDTCACGSPQGTPLFTLPDSDHDGIPDDLEPLVCGRAAVASAVNMTQGQLGHSCPTPSDYVPPPLQESFGPFSVPIGGTHARDNDRDGIPASVTIAYEDVTIHRTGDPVRTSSHSQTITLDANDGDHGAPLPLDLVDADRDLVPDQAEPWLCSAEDRTSTADGTCNAAATDYTPPAGGIPDPWNV